ncbi:hypothetical protein FK85_20650 [Halorubrum saccharovorum]|uniref:Uncharacterized protein n=1 Tax=Halorubrum saccharovorum TaxID=2248 RepID=A0A081EW95_9EURY|nr:MULTISPECIES: hypothetical protein [Halorubrum]KDS91683.1 hypothetical protein FK85_20650 [Halorubrum saccharovorum]
MTDSSRTPEPPEGLSDQIVADLEGLSPKGLRKSIVFARELLQSHEATEFPIDPELGDGVLRVTEHEGYTAVVKQHFCEDGCDDCPHGPYLYHVTEETLPDGTRETHWSFIGRVNTDAEDDD